MRAMTNHRDPARRGAERPRHGGAVHARLTSRAVRATELAVALLALGAAGCAAPTGGPAAAPGAFAAYPGFDTWRYPGDDVMRTWRAASPYRWVGYYLPAPCHRGNSFVGKRETLERQGWGVAVIYVGQQAFEGSPDPDPSTPADSIVCSRTLLTAEQGRTDARDAAERAAAEGFPPGTIVFLDVERMERATNEMVAYYRAWMEGLLADGRYRPGTYAHRGNAAELYLLAQREHARADAGAPTFWIAGGRGFTLAARPADSGLAFADVWQGLLDVDRSWGGVTLRIDENVSDRPSPSAPGGR